MNIETLMRSANVPRSALAPRDAESFCATYCRETVDFINQAAERVGVSRVTIARMCMEIGAEFLNGEIANAQADRKT